MSTPISPSPALHAQQASQPRAIAPTTTPVTLLPSTLARTYTHIHPLLVLAYYRLRFGALVADPVPTLTRDLVPLAALQVAYAVICLPACATGSKTRVEGTKGKGARGKGREGKSGKEDIWQRVTTSLLSLPLALILSPFLAALLVLFGAPLTTHLPHTLLTALHISLLAALPLFYTTGISSAAWYEIAGFMLPGDEVWGGAVGTLVGCWLGAVPIPLDWDREWQKWPVTIVTGAYLGWVLGRVLGGTVLRGKRIPFGK